MRAVLGEMQDTPYVLKGGTALLFTRGLDRHSTDLDFDSSKKLNLEPRIRDGLKAAGVELLSMTSHKNTETVQRYKIHYKLPESVRGANQLLKVETSFRDQIDPVDVETVSGIQTYRLEKIYAQKLAAAQGRSAPRDIYDLAYLTARFGSQVGEENLLGAERLSRDLDGLEGRYSEGWAIDPVLAGHTNLDETLLSFRGAVEQGLLELGKVKMASFIGQESVDGSGLTSLSDLGALVDAIEDPGRKEAARESLEQLEALGQVGRAPDTQGAADVSLESETGRSDVSAGNPDKDQFDRDF